MNRAHVIVGGAYVGDEYSKAIVRRVAQGAMEGDPRCVAALRKFKEARGDIISGDVVSGDVEVGNFFKKLGKALGKSPLGKIASSFDPFKSGTMLNKVMAATPMGAAALAANKMGRAVINSGKKSGSGPTAATASSSPPPPPAAPVRTGRLSGFYPIRAWRDGISKALR